MSGALATRVLAVAFCAVLLFPECSRSRRIAADGEKAEEVQQQIASRGAERQAGGLSGALASSLQVRALKQGAEVGPDAHPPTKPKGGKAKPAGLHQPGEGLLC